VRVASCVTFPLTAPDAALLATLATDPELSEYHRFLTQLQADIPGALERRAAVSVCFFEVCEHANTHTYIYIDIYIFTYKHFTSAALDDDPEDAEYNFLAEVFSLSRIECPVHLCGPPIVSSVPAGEREREALISPSLDTSQPLGADF
jgi:hypothetical protein